jgi:hypothetical protein
MYEHLHDIGSSRSRHVQALLGAVSDDDSSVFGGLVGL